MNDPLETSYDEIPYQSSAFHYTHPDRLAGVATLFGLKPPDVPTCRVLELGCAEGGNLIPMALGLPEGRFVGIDLSQKQIEIGHRMVEQLGLTNIDLRAMSILDLDDSFGTFDYILCHGVYSWVPEPVRAKILEVVGRNLAPDGVAYVSYNTYPGWHARGMIREMLGYHVRRFQEPRVQLQQARAFLDFLVKSSVYPDTVYTRMLRIEHEMLDKAQDSYLFHEHLESENHPYYFHEFCAHLDVHGLQYLSEATFSASEANLSPQTRQILDQLAPDPLEREQYVDFLCNRTFRRSLITRAGVAIDRSPDARVMERLYSATRVEPVDSTEADQLDGAKVDYRSTEKDVHLATNRPLVKIALWVLFERWPHAFRVDELWAEVRPLLARSDERELAEQDDPRPLAEVLLRCALSNIVEVGVHPPRFAAVVGERPVASPLARLLAPGPMPAVNLRHRIINTSDFDDILLPLLDGTRDRTALLDALAERVAADDVTIYQNGEPVRDPATLRLALGDMLDAALRNLARNSLLVA